MNEVITIGVDLAKNVFQVHGVDDEGNVVIRRQLRRSRVLPFFTKLPPCLVGIEACATAHHWGREIGALGHEVKLMPPRYVKPYVKRNKNDAADAEAICEAVTRPTMRFVAVKSAEQQGVLMLHRTRELLVRQRTMLVNAMRAHMAEFGVVARVRAHQARGFDWDPISWIALGPAAMCAAATGRTHDCTRPIRITLKTTLAKWEPSTHDPKRTFAATR